MELGQRFLSEASQALVTSLDSETTLQRVAELSVPTLGELCVVSLLGKDAALRPVAVAASSPEGGRTVREFLQAHPPSPVRGMVPMGCWRRDIRSRLRMPWACWTRMGSETNGGAL